MAQIGITEKNRAEVAKVLGILLADEFVLYTKTRNAHWNVEGPDFHSVHVYFEELYDELAEWVDEVAERIRSIGHYAPASLKTFLELTHLTELNAKGNNSKGFIGELVQDHEAIITYIRESIDKVSEAYKDEGTADFLTGIMEKHEKTAWMLRSHLK
ncbi:DNA starvation/stationary phase protection protein [Parapedobacter defluvii]|uniref:DNA starvation/stationary phase protection protein n=1 Tax=Parapedobacter defluvii TaxID=2045106 RepID=A0ABQ1MQT6_9SPHI|nr:DNA starvation/stationary phase protection protein [Parapedobacter defluvii]GGC41355.1 DNA starvation/stationary phase protection protein [Parapedobacter defluvii]